MISLATEEDATQFIRERIKSNLWWTIIGSPDGTKLAQAIESKFYDKDTAQFFDMVIVPAKNNTMPRVTAIFFARKQEMSPSQLQQLMKDIIEESPEIDGSQDVLLTPDASFGLMEWLARTVG